MWEKKGLDELDTHIPLLFAVPWIPAASNGSTTTALAEAVDVFPTLVELAGLEPCGGGCLDSDGSPVPEGVQTELQGISLVPALRQPLASGTGNASRGFKQYAFSQFPRCNCTYERDVVVGQTGGMDGTCAGEYVNVFTAESGSTGAANHHVCLFTPSEEFDWMGYSVRSDTWRYTVYVGWNGTRPVSWEVNPTGAEELYAHGEGDEADFDGETSEPVNLLGVEQVEAKWRQIADGLKEVLVAQFDNDY